MNQPPFELTVFRLYGDPTPTPPRQCVSTDGRWYSIEEWDTDLGWVSVGGRVDGLQGVAAATGACVAIGTSGEAKGWTIFLDAHRRTDGTMVDEVGQAHGEPPP